MPVIEWSSLERPRAPPLPTPTPTPQPTKKTTVVPKDAVKPEDLAYQIGAPLSEAQFKAYCAQNNINPKILKK